MPIAVVCPGCGAKLSAPDAAAGKKVKCPKPNCGTAITVPKPQADFEVVEDESPAKPAPTKPKKAVAEVDDDDDAPKVKKKPARAEADEEDEDEKPKKKRAAADEDDEERPAKRKRAADEDEEDEDEKPKKKKKQGGMSPAVIAVIALVGLLVLGGVGYGIYELTKKDETAKPNPNPPGPPIGLPAPGVPLGKQGPMDGWVEYSSDQDKFRIRLPKQMEVKDAGAGRREYLCENRDLIVNILASEIKPDTPPGTDTRKQIETVVLQTFKKNPKNKNVSQREIQYLGQTILEITTEDEIPDPAGKPEKAKAVFRVVAFEKKVYTIMVGSTEASVPSADAVFDTFQLLK